MQTEKKLNTALCIGNFGSLLCTVITLVVQLSRGIIIRLSYNIITMLRWCYKYFCGFGNQLYVYL